MAITLYGYEQQHQFGDDFQQWSTFPFTKIEVDAELSITVFFCIMRNHYNKEGNENTKSQ